MIVTSVDKSGRPEVREVAARRGMALHQKPTLMHTASTRSTPSRLSRLLWLFLGVVPESSSDGARSRKKDGAQNKGN